MFGDELLNGQAQVTKNTLGNQPGRTSSLVSCITQVAYIHQCSNLAVPQWIDVYMSFCLRGIGIEGDFDQHKQSTGYTPPCH